MRIKIKDLKDQLSKKEESLAVKELDEIWLEIKALDEKAKALQQKHKNTLKLIAAINQVYHDMPYKVYAKENDLNNFNMVMDLKEDDIQEFEKSFGIKNWEIF